LVGANSNFAPTKLKPPLSGTFGTFSVNLKAVKESDNIEALLGFFFHDSKIEFSRYLQNFFILFCSFPNFFVILQLVRGEIRTNEEAFAIISR